MSKDKAVRFLYAKKKPHKRSEKTDILDLETEKEETNQATNKLGANEPSVDNLLSNSQEANIDDSFSNLIHDKRPDNVSFHDTFSRFQLTEQSAEPEPLVGFIEVVVPPNSSQVDVPTPASAPPTAYLLKSPATLYERIRGLEIDQFDSEQQESHEMFSPRSEAELSELTDRLHSYIKRMRELRTGAPHIDSLAFFKSVDAMETEVKNLKLMYDREIEKLRRQLDALARQRNHLELTNSKLEATASDLQSRMVAEVDKSQRLMQDLSVIQRSQQQSSHELSHAKTADARLHTDSEMQRQLDQALRESMDYRRRYESELLHRKEHEEKVHQLQQQLEFNDQLSRQQQNDLQDRLSAANSAILNLEGRVRMLDRPDQDQHIADMLASVRDASERQLQKYRQEAEDMFAQNITMLKSQMDADRKSFEAVSSENRKLLGVVEELNTKIRNLQGEMLHLEHGKRSADENLEMEKDRSARHAQALESKLHDLQEMLFDKMKELNAARCMNLPLRTEVDSLRSLIEEEEQRLISKSRAATVQPTGAGSDGQHGISGRSPSPTAKVYTITNGTVPESSPAEMPSYGQVFSNAPHRAVQVEPMLRSGHSDRPGSARRPIGPIMPKYSLQGEDTANGEMPSQQQQIEPLADLPAVQGAPADLFSADAAQEALDNHGHVEHRILPTNRLTSAESVKVTPERPVSVTSHDYNHCTNSATGDIRIHEVHPDGEFVRLANTSPSKEYDFGGFTLQQNVGGSPVAVYRFPNRVQFKPKSFITVYASMNDSVVHQPPTQFYWKEQGRWGTGPECTTILCKPNGQAVAWTTAAHRFGKATVHWEQTDVDNEQPEKLPRYTRDPNSPPSEPVYLKREKESPPLLSPAKHPHGNIEITVHPQTYEARPLSLGNDNSSNQRQTRSQSTRPDPVPGEPYAGSAGQKIGSASMRRFTPLNADSGNIRKSGALTNRPDPSTSSSPPSTFMTPRNRHHAGVMQIRSQHHEDFNPPMPRPPLFSAW